jgi:predicted CopG family antitoxin
MGTKQVRLDEAVYERIKRQKFDDETFSEAIDRLTNEYTLLDFAADLEDGPSPDQRRAAIEAAEDAQREEMEHLRE